jgi:G5 domain
MIHSVLRNLRELRKDKRLVTASVGAAIMLVVALGLIFGSNHNQDTSKTAVLAASSTHLPVNKSAEAGAGSSSTSTSSSNKSSSPATTPGASTTTALKTTTNSDGTTTKEIASYTSIPFSSQTQNDGNLKRGSTKVQAGRNGVETVVYSVTYDQSGKEISRKTISDTVTKQPVKQITYVGVSDFNLNTDTWNHTEFGEMCLPADYNPGADGCAGVPSDRHFGAVEISGTFYINCISSAASNTCKSDATVNVQPVIAVRAGGTFSYQGTTYLTDPRVGGGMPQPLTSGLCSQYGLVCGSW